jgi:hypothetical protein
MLDDESAQALAGYRKIWLLLALIVLTPSGSARAGDLHQVCADKRCSRNSNLVGECFAFHGTLRPYNGNPTYRISRADTKRLYGVLCDENPIIPANLKSQLDMDLNASWNRNFSGDYEVCPFTAEKTGRMQFVCVEKVTNLVVYDRELKRIIRDERHPVSLAPEPH